MPGRGREIVLVQVRATLRRIVRELLRIDEERPRPIFRSTLEHRSTGRRTQTRTRAVKRRTRRDRDRPRPIYTRIQFTHRRTRSTSGAGYSTICREVDRAAISRQRVYMRPLVTAPEYRSTLAR